MSGRASKFIVIFILVITFAFKGAVAEEPPVHENFEDADKNLQILLDLLGDSLQLSEETLEYLVNMDYSWENISLASAKAEDLHKLLEGAETLLANLQGGAASYEDLVEYLTVFQNLDYNITALVQYYSNMQENLTMAEDFINDTIDGNTTAEEAILALNNTEINIDLLKEKVDDIENITNEIKEKGFSTTTMEELIIETKDLVESDENTTKELGKFFRVIPNFLSIYVNKTNFAVDDELTTYGYFFGEGSFKAGQNITIFVDDQIMDEVFTNTTGRYESKREIPLNHTFGVFEIHASTIYNQSLYVSNRINITIGKIPTLLALSTPYPIYSPNQSIPFLGRLIDYRSKGLAHKSITFYFSDFLGNEPYFSNITISNISTNSEGYFSYELDTAEIPIGAYYAEAKFGSDDLYIGSVSKRIDVSINIPPKLTLSALEKVVYKGENITFFGQLMDEGNNNPLSDMTIEIYIEDQKVIEVETDSSGRYEYVYSTSNMAIGKYYVHSEFNPTEIRWRKAVSNVIEIEIKKLDEPVQIQEKSLLDKIYDNILLIIFFVFLFLISAVLIARKRKTVLSSSDQMQEPKKRLIRKQYPRKVLLRKLIKETEEFESYIKLLSESKNFEDVIIAGYSALLGILEKNRVIKVKPSHTHLDIQQNLTLKGFPSKETGSITKIFEKAMYSNSPIERRNIDDFLASIRKMFTPPRGISG